MESSMARSNPCWLALLGLLITAQVATEARAAPADDLDALDRRVGELRANAASWRNATQAGKRAVFFCVNCHGEMGLGKLPHVPNLAGQNPVYLMAQIQKFADGRRKDNFMSGLIRALKEEDRLAMAIYYSTLSVPPGRSKNAREVQQGQALFGRMCVGCHAGNALGGRNVARLAGQSPEYLIESLSKYRARSGERTDPAMTSVASKLSDEQIRMLAAYLSTLS
jgi:cytochrome c553